MQAVRSLSHAISERPLFFWGIERTFVVCVQPLTCPQCKTEHYFFLNRNGRTLCAICDAPAGVP
jgi:hypothetical protein